MGPAQDVVSNFGHRMKETAPPVLDDTGDWGSLMGVAFEARACAECRLAGVQQGKWRGFQQPQGPRVGGPWKTGGPRLRGQDGRFRPVLSSKQLSAGASAGVSPWCLGHHQPGRFRPFSSAPSSGFGGFFPAFSRERGPPSGETEQTASPVRGGGGARFLTRPGRPEPGLLLCARWGPDAR